MFILSLQQMQDIQSQLDSEKKKSKDLASQIVKLNGIIKTGQDAIHQEQELVTKLKQQLEEREKVKQGSEEQGRWGEGVVIISQWINNWRRGRTF